MIYLPRSAAALASICADQAQRYSMTGVRVIEYAGGFWRCEATDGRKAAILRGQSEPDVMDLRLVEQAMLGEGEECHDLVVPAQELTAAARSIPKGHNKYGKEPKLCVRMTAGGIALVGASVVVRAHPVEGSFPPIDSVLPTEPARVSVSLNPAYLIDLLKLAIEVSKGGPEEQRVTLHWWKHAAPVGLTAKGKDGVLLDALLMPLT